MMKNRFKKGDRVVWTGKYDDTVANRGAAEARVAGTVTKDSDAYSTHVKWDEPSKADANGIGSGIFNDNLELLVTKIDTTKPLEYFSAGVMKTGPAPFITMTSEGHIMVGRCPTRYAPGSALEWALFTDTGELVRTSDGTGSSLALRNSEVKTTEYIAILPSGMPVVNLTNPKAGRDETFRSTPEAQFAVRLHKTNGVVTNVDVVKR